MTLADALQTATPRRNTAEPLCDKAILYYGDTFMESLLSYLSPLEWILASVVVGVLFFVFGLIGLPFDEHKERGRRVFWTCVMALAELVLGFLVSVVASINANLDSLQRQVNAQQQDLRAALAFGPVLTEYETHFTNITDPLAKWANTLKDYLDRQFRNGLIPITKEDAPRLLAESYVDAKKFAVAVNVGSTSFYFGHNAAARVYVQENKRAMARGIPVIRFYIYKSEIAIMQSDNKPAPDFVHFVNDVKHNVAPKTGAVYSGIIDISDDPLHAPPRDLLFIDGRFLAETEIATDDWIPLRAHATVESQNISDIPNYINELVARVEVGNVYELSNADLQARYEPLFRRYSGWIVPRGEILSDCIYQDVLKQVGASDTTDCTPP